MKRLLEKYPEAKTLNEIFYRETGYSGDFPHTRKRFESWIVKNDIKVEFDKYGIPLGVNINL